MNLLLIYCRSLIKVLLFISLIIPPILDITLFLSLVKLAHKALHDETWPKYLKVNKMISRGRNLRSENENESILTQLDVLKGLSPTKLGRVPMGAYSNSQ